MLQTTLETGSQDGMNLVVFGGGFAATLAAFLVHSVFEVRYWPPVTCSSRCSHNCEQNHLEYHSAYCAIGYQIGHLQWVTLSWTPCICQERCAAVFVWGPGTTDADFARAQYLASFLGACSFTIVMETPNGVIIAALVDSACANTSHLHLHHALSALQNAVCALCARRHGAVAAAGGGGAQRQRQQRRRQPPQRWRGPGGRRGAGLL